MYNPYGINNSQLETKKSNEVEKLDEVVKTLSVMNETLKNISLQLEGDDSPIGSLLFTADKSNS